MLTYTYVDLKMNNSVKIKLVHAEQCSAFPRHVRETPPQWSILQKWVENSLPLRLVLGPTRLPLRSLQLSGKQQCHKDMGKPHPQVGARQPGSSRARSSNACCFEFPSLKTKVCLSSASCREMSKARGDAGLAD